MAGVGPGDLHDLADELLAACVESLDTIPLFTPGLVGAPERSFVSPGDPAADCCPQLTVHTTGLTEAGTEPGGLQTGKRLIRGRINHVGLIVTIFRCIPVPKETISKYEPPDVAELEAAAEQTNADAWAIWNGIGNRVRAGVLFETCREVFMEGMRSIPPSGGCGGWILSIRVSLDGYEEVLP